MTTEPLHDAARRKDEAGRAPGFVQNRLPPQHSPFIPGQGRRAAVAARPTARAFPEGKPGALTRGWSSQARHLRNEGSRPNDARSPESRATPGQRPVSAADPLRPWRGLRSVEAVSAEESVAGQSAGCDHSVSLAMNGNLRWIPLSRSSWPMTVTVSPTERLSAPSRLSAYT